MPFGGPDWLALTLEPTLEPELPICDPHHHFWDLRTERMPYQRYLLHELAADIHSGHNVRSTVFIEARAMYRADGPEERRPVGEVEFVQGLAAANASGLYGPGRAAAAIIGHANLHLGDRVEPVLDALQETSPTRCMFESNFPVDKVSYSYNVLYNAFKRLSKEYSAGERAALFHDTAVRIYRIDV